MLIILPNLNDWFAIRNFKSNKKINGVKSIKYYSKLFWSVLWVNVEWSCEIFFMQFEKKSYCIWRKYTPVHRVKYAIHSFWQSPFEAMSPKIVCWIWIKFKKKVVHTKTILLGRSSFRHSPARRDRPTDHPTDLTDTLRINN